MNASPGDSRRWQVVTPLSGLISHLDLLLRGGERGGVAVSAHLAELAPCLMSAVMMSSWPCRAAMCRAVFLFLSSQSMSAPTHNNRQ